MQLAHAPVFGAFAAHEPTLVLELCKKARHLRFVDMAALDQRFLRTVWVFADMHQYPQFAKGQVGAHRFQALAHACAKNAQQFVQRIEDFYGHVKGHGVRLLTDSVNEDIISGLYQQCSRNTMPTDIPASLVQRIRHPFVARHVQLLARETLSPGFVRLTLGGPELTGFVSTGFDDHVKLILPQAGQEKPNLPAIVDGRPHIEGARPTMRDYTPICYDAGMHTLQIDFAVHDGGPAVDWALQAPLGQWVGLAGPRGSMQLSTDLDWQVLLGDETAMPAIERRLTELPAGTHAIVRVQIADPADQRAWTSKAVLDCAFVPSLSQAVEQLVLPAGTGFVWGAGENTLMSVLRASLLSKGVDAKRMRLSAYWKRGVADHHEEIGAR